MLRTWPQSRVAWMILAALLALAGTLLWPGRARGQKQLPNLPTPQLLLVSPCGARAGTEVEITVSGQELDEPEGLLFSHPGIKAEPLGPAEPPKVAMKGKKKGGGKMKLAANASQRFKVTVPADTPLGIHDVRVIARGGLTNPRAFVVGDLREHNEKEPNSDVPEAQRVELNCTVNGVIAAPTDVDYYRFSGKKGQRVVVSCRTSSIDSRLPAVVQVYSAAGSALADNRNYRDDDAVCDATLPEDGDYYVRVSSFTYTRGGPDHFYRLTISTAPWIDAVFPAVVEAGKTARVTVYGRNLPGGKPDPTVALDGHVLEKAVVTVQAPGDARGTQRLRYGGHVAPPASALDGFELRLRNDAGASNPSLITFAHAPVVLGAGDNHAAEKAQRLTLPCEVVGRIRPREPRDWYAFRARKGEVWSIEVQGERLGAPVDLYAEVRQAGANKALAELDDDPEILSLQFYTRSDDPPRYRFVVPADGDYEVVVGARNASAQPDPRQIYHLRITPERPDFRVIAMPPGGSTPDAAIIGRGGHQLYNLMVWRLDGFTRPITVSAEGLPPGVEAPPQVIPAGAKQAPFVVSAAPDAAPWAGEVRLVATATVDGKKVEREVRAATASWPVPQQNIPTLTRVDRQLVLAVRGEAPYRLNVETKHLDVAPGGKARVKIHLARLWPDVKGPVQLTAIGLPKDLTFKPFTVAAGKDAAEVVFDVKNNAAAGTYSVVLRGQAQVPSGRAAKGKTKANVALVQPSTPVRITVLPKELAKVSVNPKQLKVRVGGRTELTVTAKRLHDYDGEFKVRLVIPNGARGLAAEEVVIPAGKEEARLTLTAAPDAAVGTPPGLTVQVVGRFEDRVQLTQTAKVNVSVQK